MTFQELLQTVEFDDVWSELEKTYRLKGEAFKTYFQVFNQLKGLTPGPNYDGFRLVVARVEDELPSGSFIYDVFGIKPGDHEHYALELSSWSEWLSFEIDEKCVYAYDTTFIVAHSLYELTFFGYEVDEVEANIKKGIDSLKERRE